MNHTKTQKLLPIKILEAYTGIYYQVLLFRRKKIKMFKAFSWAKNTARGVRFLLRFNMYLFWAQCEQVYVFLAPFKIVFFILRRMGKNKT